MKAPWFPFYTGDFLASASVQDMEAHEVGAYVLLLARSWQSDTPGYIEDDEYAMRRAGRLSAEQWAEAKNSLLKKWPLATDKPGYRHNPRLLKEAGKQVELREKKAEAGRLSAERRAAAATQRQQTANTNPTGVDQSATGVDQKGNYSQPQSQPHSSKEEGRKKGQAGGQDSASPTDQPPESKKPNQEKGGAAAGPQLWPDEAQVFLTANFNAYLDKIGYCNVDKRVYLGQCQTRAEELKEQRNEDGWRAFVKSYFNIERANNRLMLPMPFEQPVKPAIQPMPANPRASLWGFDDAPPSTVAEPRPILQPKPAGQFAGPIIR